MRILRFLKRSLCWLAAPFVAAGRLIFRSAPAEQVAPKAAASSASAELRSPVILIVPAQDASPSSDVVISETTHVTGAVVIQLPRGGTISNVDGRLAFQTVSPSAHENDKQAKPATGSRKSSGIGKLLAWTAGLALLIYLNHAPWAVFTVEVARSLGLFDIVGAAARHVVEFFCQRSRFCASIREEVEEALHQPVGKAIGRQLGILATHAGPRVVDALCRRWHFCTVVREFFREPVDQSMGKVLGAMKRAAKSCWEWLTRWREPRAGSFAPAPS